MNRFSLLFISALFFSCSHQEKKTIKESVKKTDLIIPLTTDTIDPVCDLEKKLEEAGLVRMQNFDPSIRYELKYSTQDNFMKKDVYGEFDDLYLQPDVAGKLSNAQKFLKEEDSSLTLLVYDGVRPRSVQQIMWDVVDMPNSEKGKFVSNPKNASIHNFGAAVDLTIADTNGVPLDMGTEFDHIGELAYPTMEYFFLKDGQLTEKQVNNRKLLRKVMYKAGFSGLTTEWWHFNSCSREEAKTKYKILE